MEQIPCPVCGQYLRGGENFCFRCGHSLRGERGARRGEPDTPRWLEIEFQKSSSSSYAAALDLCEGNPSYRTFERNGLTIHRIGFRAEDGKAFLRLANYVRNWKSFRLFVDGREENWRSFFYCGYYCYEDRLSSPNANQYCFGESCDWFNWWGCHRLGFGFYGEEDWYRCGRMTEDEVFVLDKDRLRRILLSRARTHVYCPVLNTKAVLDRIEMLPTKIDPRANPDWEYYYLDWRYDPQAPPAAAVPVCSPSSSIVSLMIPPDVVVPNPPERSWAQEDRPPPWGPDEP